MGIVTRSRLAERPATRLRIWGGSSGSVNAPVGEEFLAYFNGSTEVTLCHFDGTTKVPLTNFAG